MFSLTLHVFNRSIMEKKQYTMNERLGNAIMVYYPAYLLLLKFLSGDYERSGKKGKNTRV